MEANLTGHSNEDKGHVYVINNMNVTDLSEVDIARNYLLPGFELLGYEQIIPIELSLNSGSFNTASPFFPVVAVVQQTGRIILNCECHTDTTKLCSHMAEVLLQVIRREHLRIFFDQRLRCQKIKKVAVDYGLADAADLDALFTISLRDHHIDIKPAQDSLFAVTKDSLDATAEMLLPDNGHAAVKSKDLTAGSVRIIVIKQHKYYKHLQVELYDAPVTKDDKIKNPLVPVAPMDLVWDSDDPLELKFFTAVARFQQSVDDKVSAPALTSLRAIVRNPLQMDCYMHDSVVSEKVAANALQKVKLDKTRHDVQITVDEKGQFYEVSGKLKIGEVQYNLAELEIKYSYFIALNDTIYLVKDLAMLGAVSFFKQRAGNLLIHQSKFKEFQTRILSKLENTNAIAYPYIKPATPKQLAKHGFNKQEEKIIYLSDFGPHVMIIPVMRYGEAEIPVRTQQLIYAADEKGKQFLVQRKEAEELDFMAMILKQHSFFEEQLENQLQYFYLHKRRFLDEDWFLNVFETWQDAGITILGFSELTGNNLNPNKVKITVQVLSGVNWFNSVIKARFGRQKASLQHLHKAIRNKTKFVRLDDGTMGILPDEWIAKFTTYFAAGEILDDETLRTSKSNYQTIERLYEDQMLDEHVRREIVGYKEKFNNFEQIADVPVPADFVGTLRHYQQQGLNWLNFLDDFDFGGCLTDDMGLGKTIQIIAFILSQRAKVSRNTNLLVVPTSLIFNWQAEVAKFAPSIKIHTIYGADRLRHTDHFDQYEVVLTSYGTLLSDINFLKDYQFNYVFLDESQNIKNPNSQRYKAACLLKARNRIVITGTPIENNTFDIYGQLSFACPGLLGTRQYFKDIYSSPVDKFKVKKRSAELQQKIAPFILRRTKDQVATELPDKTEMVLYCEMEHEQRSVYEAYEKEFREYISAITQDELPRKSMTVLKGITKLRQICDSPKLLNGERVPGDASAKIDVLMEQIMSKSPKHKILVFSQFVTMLDLIKTELNHKKIKYAYLTGATRNRGAVVNEFQDNDDVRVFLISLKAGGTGLNLTAADYIYLVDPWWNPAIENQAIDRCYRIGQEKHVVAVRLICPDTIEEKMVQLQQTKKHLVNTLIQTEGSIFKSLSKNDLMAMLGA